MTSLNELDWRETELTEVEARKAKGVEHACIKGLITHRFVFSGAITSLIEKDGMKAMDWRLRPIIYQLSERKSGGLYRSQKDSWIALEYCPICGAYIGEADREQID